MISSVALGPFVGVPDSTIRSVFDVRGGGSIGVAVRSNPDTTRHGCH